ncbi:centrosomal protein of 97 kDa isoform X3 [Cryptotermes secundus]|uniref:centrosomal protein of 97 kDa isoform X3 n=1 Tax=Cryptotermes secundus TaxID=105785 RepID=UPI000CD7C2A4|nr:centrosomal protein of 97 kDa isoform X3 [Cryptotermes secundus]
MAAEELHDTLDLSRQGLKKLSKAQPHDAQVVTTLIVDNNELQRWDNIDSYTVLKKLSVTNNQLLRMYGVARLHGLITLNLANNNILTIEGLKDLVHLKWLCLAANSIKTIEHLNTNINLEHLDLSDNSIVHVSDVSHLKSLKHLLLHGNRISQLRQCERHLPPSIVMLTLASNNITDLNEMSHLVHLTNLREFSIINNPCINMTGNCIGFDYRPFVINWCMGLKVIDGFVVDAIESLKAEWLYSQGRGRQFQVGEHQALTQYLASVCPLSGDSLESEDDRKLRLILSKAQQHQQQLREQLTADGRAVRGRAATLNRSLSSPATRRHVSNNRSSVPRQSNMSKESKLPVADRCRIQSPDRMVNSCNAVTSNDLAISVVGSDDISSSPLMTRSLDPALLYTSSSVNLDTNNCDQSENLSTQLVLEDCSTENEASGINCPLQTATKMVPVPESLMSPDYRPAVSTGMTGRGVRPKSATLSHTQNRRPVSRGSPKLPRSLHSSPLLSRQRGGQTKQCAASLTRRRTSPQRTGQQEVAQLNSSEDEDSEMSASKLETIRHRAQERWQRKEATSNSAGSNSSAENAAVCIQRMWRGYHTRNLNRRVMEAYHDIRAARTQEYIQKLSSDMEATRAALESERKLQLLQMQAINALWKKVVSLQPMQPQPGTSASSTDAGISLQQPDAETVRELTQTCTRLHSQVEQLQDSMQSVMQCMSLFCQKGQVVIPHLTSEAEADGVVTGSTQTDIVAVHTPQMESGPGMPFPYQKAAPSTRPSSLPISQSRLPPALRNSSAPESDAPQELQQFATSLVDGVLRTVAEQGGETETEIDKRNYTSDQGEVNFSVEQNQNDADGSREGMTEDICGTAVENGQEDHEINEGVRNGNSASDEGSGETALDEEGTQKTVVSQGENNSCVMITTEPPSTPSSPFEQLDSPNNNQHPIERNVVQ